MLPPPSSATSVRNWQRVFFSGKRRGITKDGFSYRPAASIPPRSRLARRLRARGRARIEPYGGQRQILCLDPVGSGVADLSGRSRPVAARNGASIRRNACSARRIFQRRLKIPSRPGARLSPKPRSQRCGSLRTCSGLEGRPQDRSKICPPKRGPDLASMFGISTPKQALNALSARVLQLRAARTKALSAPFDNPSLSWNMTGARSLDYARG